MNMSPVKIIADSTKIIASNKLVFITIIALTTLPLSALTLFQSTSTHSLSSHIHRLHRLALLAPTRFESRHVFKHSRHHALSLLCTRALFSLPSFLLSLAAALLSVHSSLSNSPSLRSAAAAVSCHRLFLTSLFVYAILFAFSPIPFLLQTLTSSAGSGFVALAIVWGLEVYLMAVLSLAMVVSVAEERYGWEAIRVGYGLMEGRRVCGWMVSCVFAAVSGMIVREMDAVMRRGFGEKGIVVFGYAVVVVWSYVIMTVFYCDCRTRHPIKEPLPPHLSP